MKISLLFIVFVFNYYAKTEFFRYKPPREVFSKSQGSSELNVSVWLLSDQSYDAEMLSLICNTSRVDGEIWWANDEVNLTNPVEAKNGSEASTIWNIKPDTRKDAGDFTCVANTTEGTFLKKTIHIGKIEPPRMISPVKMHDVLVNDSVTLACEVTGYPLEILRWMALHTSTEGGWMNMTELTYINETFLRMSINFKSVQHADAGNYYCVAGDYDTFTVENYEYLKVNDYPSIEWNLVLPVGVDKLYFEIPDAIGNDHIMYPFFQYLKNDTKEWRVHTMIDRLGRDGYVVSKLERSTWYNFRISFLDYPRKFGTVYYERIQTFEEEPEFVPDLLIEGITLDSIKIKWSETPPNLRNYLDYYEVNASPGNEIAEVTKTTFVLKNVQREINYTLKVRACNNLTRDCCDWSLETKAVRIDRDPEFVPKVFKKANTLTSITIGWTSPPLEMRRYVHNYKIVAKHWNYEIEPAPLPISLNSYTFENLEQETSYLIKVAACGKYEMQCGNWSPEIEIFTINYEKEVLIWPSLAVAAVLSIIVGAWIGTQKRRQKAARRKMMRAVLEQFNAGALDCLNPELNITDQAELLPYNKKWEFPRKLLKLDKVLGSGAFGIVRKAQAQSITRPKTVTTVAVKLVRATARLNYMTALDRELKILGYLGKHLNVVNLLGACTKNINYGELLVIVEFCRFGNLRDYLIRRRDDFIGQIDTASAITITASLSASGDKLDNTQNSTDQNEEGVDSDPVTDAIEPVRLSKYQGDYNDEDLEPIETRDLICWIWQVSRGMKFLGSRRVIHGDLAARNILLADHNVVKICDFGMAKALQADEDYKKKGHDPLPVKWMAIESLRDRVFSYQSDIWSFGIVLWEFFSLGATPYPGIDPGSLYQKLKDGFRMERPKYATAEIYYMMQFCWDAEPARRPSFEQLEDILADLLDESVKTHYIDLGQPYVKMNDDALSHGKTDYLTMTPSIGGTNNEEDNTIEQIQP